MRRVRPWGWLAALATLLAGCDTGLGERCGMDSDCASGLVCARPAGDEGPAASGVCDYPLRERDEPCTVAAECAQSLTCSNHFAVGDRYGTCVPRREDGSSCFANRDCESNHCEGASGTALDGTCAP